MLSVMFVKMLTLIFFLTKDFHHSDAETTLAPPADVKVISVNMGAVVQWTSPHNPTSNVTYTVVYLSCNRSPRSSSVCVNIRELKCDAGKLPAAFGCYTFQVRAEAHGISSKWVNASTFIPNQHTIIGPPDVRLVIQNNTLEVFVQPPVLKIGTVSTAFSDVSYVIRYWTDGVEEASTEKKVTKSSDEDVKLNVKGLHLWSRYCAQAKVLPRGYTNVEQYSTPVCVTNTPVYISCVIAAVVFLPLSLLVTWLIYKVYRFLYPKTKLPEHLKNLLVPSFWSAEATQHPPHQKEQHDKISTISEDHLYEEFSEKSKISEDKESEMPCELAPMQEVEEDYKLLMNIKPAPSFYPNQLYPLCLKNSLFNPLNQPCFSSSQHCYYNVALMSSEQKHTQCVS